MEKTCYYHYNGTSYIVQRGAEATYSPKGKAITKNIEYYLTNACHYTGMNLSTWI